MGYLKPDILNFYKPVSLRIAEKVSLGFWIDCIFPLHSLQTILGIPSLEHILNPAQIIPRYIMYNMTNTTKHGVVLPQDKSGKCSNIIFKVLSNLNMSKSVI